MTSVVLTASGLVLLSLFLIYSDFKKWRALCRADVDPTRISFGRRQMRRRIFSSSLIGIVGIALLGSPWMLEPRQNQFWWYWAGMLMMVMLLGVMACLDVLDSVRYFRNVQHQLLLKRQESLGGLRDGDAGIQESP